MSEYYDHKVSNRESLFNIIKISTLKDFKEVINEKIETHNKEQVKFEGKGLLEVFIYS